LNEETRRPVKINDIEWESTRSTAKAVFVNEKLGARPTQESVRASRHDAPKLSFVMWWGIVTLVVLTIVTSFKAIFVAWPFAITFSQQMLEGQSIEVWVISAFQFSMALLAILMATPALIFFKLLSEEDRIIKKIKETQREGWFLKWLDLNYVTPRLPSAMVWGTMAWLVYTAAHGVTELGDGFLRFLPVVMELALARLVGDILQQGFKFDSIVSEVLKQETERWDKAADAFEDDDAYNTYLFQRLRSAIINLTRLDERKRKYQPNLWMMEAGGDVVNKFVISEYERLTGGQAFAVAVKNIRKNRAAGQPEAVVNATAEAVVADTNTRRVPPHGDKEWTTESLIRDFELRGLSKEEAYDRGRLDREYASGYGARGAWNSGAMAFFTANAASS
jgi:hypothetical protein